MPICVPEVPLFASEAETATWMQLRESLPNNAYLIANWSRADEDGEFESDLIVAWPGCGVFLIEVKGGFIEHQPDGTWTSTDRHGEQHVIAPVTQATRNAHKLSDLIEHEWSQGTLRIPWLLAFPDTTLPTSFRSSHVSRGRIVDADDLPGIADQLRRIGKEGGHRSDASLRRCELLADMLADVRDEQQSLIGDQADRERILRRLTEEQFELLDTMGANDRFAVLGPAGSGKTYLALEQARRLAAEGRRIAVVCFSRGLARFLERVADGWPTGERPAYIGTFHSLAVAWGVVVPEDADAAWWTSVCPERMAEAAQALGDDARFDAIIVDEAQDFASSWWSAITAGMRGARGLFVFGDLDQDLFARGELRALGLATARLSRNLRNARPIAEMASLLASTPAKHLGMSGPPVQFEPCARGDAVAVADGMIDGLLATGWEPRDIVIITTNHRHPVQLERGELGRDAYWDTLWDDDDIFYAHVTGFKGLERPVVVLAIDGWQDPARAREYLYVAMTRARDLLIVCGDPADLQTASTAIADAIDHAA